MTVMSFGPWECRYLGGCSASICKSLNFWPVDFEATPIQSTVTASATGGASMSMGVWDE